MIICAFTGLLTPIGDTPYTYLVTTEHDVSVTNNADSPNIGISIFLILSLAF